jgi:hypothetical protein
MNDNIKMKGNNMRTRTENRYGERLSNRFTILPTKVSVNFNPGRSSVLPVHIVATREYLRNLRAAEMSDWEKSGGDFLISE